MRNDRTKKKDIVVKNNNNRKRYRFVGKTLPLGGKCCKLTIYSAELYGTLAKLCKIKMSFILMAEKKMVEKKSCPKEDVCTPKTYFFSIFGKWFFLSGVILYT